MMLPIVSRVTNSRSLRWCYVYVQQGRTVAACWCSRSACKSPSLTPHSTSGHQSYAKRSITIRANSVISRDDLLRRNNNKKPRAMTVQFYY